MDLKIFRGEHSLIDLESIYVNDFSSIKNRTRAYLNPLLNYHGKEFRDKLNKMPFFASGLYDRNRERFPNTITRLVKSDEIIKDLPHLVDDYPFGELLYGKLHALVIQLPEQFNGVIEKFENGEYSKMFDDPSKIYNLRSNDKDYIKTQINVEAICKKCEDYKKDLEEHLGTRLPANAELDSKPNLIMEIFNFNEN